MATRDVDLSVRTRGPVAPERAEVEVLLPVDREAGPLGRDVCIPSLALEVRDPRGRAVLLAPPALPEPKDEGLPADGEGRVRILYAAFLDPRLAAGRYAVRFSWPPPAARGHDEPAFASPWVDLELGPPERPGPGDIWPPEPWLRRLLGLFPDLLFLWPCRRRRARRVRVCRSERIGGTALGSCGAAVESSSTCAYRAGLYRWYAGFDLTVDPTACEVSVVVRLRYQVSSEVPSTYPVSTILDNLRSVIRGRWHDKFRLCVEHACCPDGYPIHVDVVFLPVGSPLPWHHFVQIQTTTTHMTAWSYTTDKVEHEFGHMLGAKDEYCTVDGRHHCRPHLGYNIMNTNAKNPIPEHFALVAEVASRLLRRCCRVEPIDQACPPLGVSVA